MLSLCSACRCSTSCAGGGRRAIGVKADVWMKNGEGTGSEPSPLGSPGKSQLCRRSGVSREDLPGRTGSKCVLTSLEGAPVPGAQDSIGDGGVVWTRATDSRRGRWGVWGGEVGLRGHAGVRALTE